jgi:acetamidase/formamidase
MVGFDEDLDKAFNNALGETIDFLVTAKGLTRYEAYSLASIAADCRVSQVVDVRKGIHCMIAKSLFTGRGNK